MLMKKCFLSIVKTFILVLSLPIPLSSIAYADACSASQPGSQVGPAPSFRNWPWGDACYIVWPGGGGSTRSSYEDRCRQIDNFIHFEGDYGSNRNVCVFGQAEVQTKSHIDSALSSPAPTLSDETRNTIAYFQAKSGQMHDYAQAMFEYDFSRSARLKDTAMKFQSNAAKWLESDEIFDKLKGASSKQIESIISSIPASEVRLRCMGYLQEAGNNLGQSGRLDVAELMLQNYNDSCGADNHYGLNSVQQSLAWRAKELRNRMSTVLKEMEFEFWSIGEFQSSQCKAKGGYPESGVSSPKDKDPIRRCFMTKYRDFRAIRIGRQYDGMCPDGSAVSSTGTCPAK